MKQTYSTNIEKYTLQRDLLKSKNKKISIIRVLLFLWGLLSVYFLREFNLSVLSGAIIIVMIPFIILVIRSGKNKTKIGLLEELIKINKNEISCLENDFSVFHSGKEFLTHEHEYSYDLDIFGNDSLFAYINRTCTVSGKLKLFTKFASIEKNKDTIISYQKAVQELEKEIDWRQKFQAIGYQFTIKEEMYDSALEDNIKKDLENWTKEEITFIKNPVLRIILILFPAITCVSAGLSIFDLPGSFLLIPMIIIQLFISGIFLKKINSEHNKLSNKSKNIKKAELLLEMITSLNCKSELLLRLKTKLLTDKEFSIERLNKLRKFITSFDNRLNFLFALISNMFLLWDLQLLSRLEKMKKELQIAIPEWFDVIGEFDMISSLSNYSNNATDSCYPAIKTGDFILDIKSGSHPLLPANQRISNDFILAGTGKMTIVTGANMAGKSTFLRTVGMNIILASTGAKVCAEKFIISPVDIHTSIRINDSLHKNESYFYAELMRIKSIINRLKTGEKLFIILDEILKGTNSADKHRGSYGLIEQLIKFDVAGIIATHDVQLGELENIYTGKVQNKRFEVEIKDDNLSFNYKLQDGVSQNLNAYFLMKKYGIIE